MTLPTPALLACPRCDKTPLETLDGGYRCVACKVDFPRVAGIPWLFAEPDASLGEWRNRLRMALGQLDRDIANIDAELQGDGIGDATTARLRRLAEATQAHRQQLAELLGPVGLDGAIGQYETYLALRTRLPLTQGLNTYYANVHRDWAWGDEENAASVVQIRAVLDEDEQLGKVAVLGAGAGRLAYDLHQSMDCETTFAVDFNPLLAIIARAMAQGDSLQMFEFPIAPRKAEDVAVRRNLSAPTAADDGFHVLLADVLRPPLAKGAFDTVVTPWLIDVIDEALPAFAARVNRLLAPGGRWLNFGSLAFDTPEFAKRYSPEELVEIVRQSGFAEPRTEEASIPYMCSPASRHGRRENVFTFAARKEKDPRRVERYKALPDWLVTGKEPVPLSPAFQEQFATTRIYAFVMSLIDGKRSIQDMAAHFEQQRLMTREEAVPAIRNFLTRMYDDAGKTGF